MSSTPAIRRALRHLVRTIKRFEPDYASAVERGDTQWLKDNFVPMNRAVLKALIELADAVQKADLDDDDLFWLEPTYHAAVAFLRSLSEATGMPLNLSHTAR